MPQQSTLLGLWGKQCSKKGKDKEQTTPDGKESLETQRQNPERIPRRKRLRTDFQSTESTSIRDLFGGKKDSKNSGGETELQSEPLSQTTRTVPTSETANSFLSREDAKKRKSTTRRFTKKEEENKTTTPIELPPVVIKRRQILPRRASRRVANYNEDRAALGDDEHGTST